MMAPGCIREIKHDGVRMMVRRDAAGVRLLTRNGHDWADRYPLIAEAAGALGGSGRGGLGCVVHGGTHQSLGKHFESLPTQMQVRPDVGSPVRS
jgi:ATP-dependent DNA ligase